MTQDISLNTLPRIQWDTNVFVRALVTGSDDLLDFLLSLYEQHEQKIIDFHNPLAVQSEFYGILAAGRIKIGRMNQVFTHDQIVEIMSPFPEIFELEVFIPSLQELDWKPGQGIAYKETWREVIQNTHGWNDFGEEFLSTRLRHPLSYFGLADKYDWPIMAAAVQRGIDLLVTVNMGDFTDPLAKIRVMDAYKATKFAIEELHFVEFPREEK